MNNSNDSSYKSLRNSLKESYLEEKSNNGFMLASFNNKFNGGCFNLFKIEDNTRKELLSGSFTDDDLVQIADDFLRCDSIVDANITPLDTGDVKQINANLLIYSENNNILEISNIPYAKALELYDRRNIIKPITKTIETDEVKSSENIDMSRELKQNKGGINTVYVFVLLGVIVSIGLIISLLLLR